MAVKIKPKRTLLLVCSFMFFGQPHIFASDDTWAASQKIAIKKLARNASLYINKAIRVEGIRCVDQPSAGFVCLADAEGRFLKIDAVGLGPQTTVKVAEKIIDECKGTHNLTRRVCEFSISITPTSYRADMIEIDGKSLPLIIVFSNEIEFEQ